MKYFLSLILGILTLTNFCQANEEYDNYLAEWKVKCAPLLAQWHTPAGKNDDSLRTNLIEAAVRSEQSEIVEEIAAGGDVAKLEIKLPSEEEKHMAQAVWTLDEIPSIPYGNRMDCVIRRMTKTRFEVWTPSHGWLFNAAGHLVSEALPPRRDGVGREWHGAFLPDGRWVTTDLWEMDKTLTFFSRKGKLMKEIKAAVLAPARADEPWSLNLIGWARCDSKGEGWVVSVGDGPGRTRVFALPEGKTRLLKDDAAPWKLCYPRDLGPKGMFTALWCYSDDCKRSINFSSPAHGMYVGYPTFTWNEKENSGTFIPNGDHDFGFLPGSYDVFIGASDYDDGDTGRPRHLKTWFFASGGKCLAWLRAAYLTDSADGKETWYADEDHCVVTLGPDLKPKLRMRFIIEGANAAPVKLFTDLHLGFFTLNKRLVLARW